MLMAVRCSGGSLMLIEERITENGVETYDKVDEENESFSSL